MKEEKLTATKLRELDRRIKKELPEAFREGVHLTEIYTVVHYKTKWNEMNAFRMIRDEEDLRLDTKTILRLYGALTKNTNAKNRSWKTEPNAVGGMGTFFVTATPEDTPVAMEALCEKYAYLGENVPEGQSDEEMEARLDDICRFLLEFACIHPMADGNGRLSVLLGQMLMKKAGLSCAVYTPWDSVMKVRHKREHFKQILHAAGICYGMRPLKYDAFIPFLKSTMKEAYETLSTAVWRYRSVSEKTGKVRVEIKRQREDLYQIVNIIDCDDECFEAELKEITPDLYLSGKTCELPPVFASMREGADNSITVIFTKENLFRTDRGYEIRNLSRDDFSFLLRGKEGEAKILDADLSRQYEHLLKSLMGTACTETDIDFSKIDENWNAEEIFDKDRLTPYILQKRYGFCAVYYEMFKDLFRELDCGSTGGINLHVVSVGTGSKTDAISLNYAIREEGACINKSKWIGIDLKAWSENEFFAYFSPDDTYIPLPSYQSDTLTPGEFFIKEENRIFEDEIAGSVEDFHRDAAGARTVYLVVFPNVLSEFQPGAELKDLMDRILSVYRGKEAYLLTSINRTKMDKEQMEILHEKYGEPIVDHPIELTNRNHIFEMYDYTEKAGESITDLMAELSRERDSCDPDYIRTPVKRQQYIGYRIFKLPGN